MLNRISVVLLVLFISPLSFAEVQHKLLRKFAVFPIAEANVSSAEDAWWSMREVLTNDQRFYVASRRFMINRGVFQARKDLTPADAIILGKILDAQALIVSYVDERTFRFFVYDAVQGFTIWKSEIQLHPVLPIKDQLIRISSQVMSDFVAKIPYHGFQVIDEVLDKPLFEFEGTQRALVFVGNNNRILVGDAVQWIEVSGNPATQVLGEEAKINVFAEGIVRSLKGDKVEVEVIKARSLSELGGESLVRFPKEIERLKEIYSTADKSANLGSEYLSAEIRPVSDFSRDHNATSTAMMWIINIAAFVLLAF